MLHPNDKKTFLFNEAMEAFTDFFQRKNRNIRHSIVKITEDLSERQLDDAISTAKKTYPKMFFQRNESLTEVTIVGNVAKVAGNVDQVEKARDLLCETLNGVSHVSSSTRNNPNAHVSMNSGTTSIANPMQENNQDTCPICMDHFKRKTSLIKCKHSFCEECIDQAMKSKSVCPICQTVYGKLEGDQPKDASMNVTTYYTTHVPGYEKYGTIEIHYDVPSGRQGPEHPHPGKLYQGTTRTAYLPDSPEGKHVLSLLRRAFDQRLIFTIGTSSTTGLQDCVTWNDIHHKTTKHGGPDSYGYPDRDYLKRVQEELKAKGSEHPHPGKPYHGTTRTAYLPASPEGRHVLGLLRRAFDQRLIFTIGTSSTTELHDCVTWNDIQHKTSTHEGPDSYGYPDRDYLKRVQEQLKAKGIF
ncbi:E3 ubiquitin-protein ligase DTX3L-like [Lampetra planeri]